MQRIALQLEYIGTAYHGWQRQAQVASVQSTLESAIALLTSTPIETICAGRTDAGVHASAQVVHFDSPVQRPIKQWLNGLNANLPSDIRVIEVHEVSEAFHARFTANRRRYHYFIDQRYWPDVFCRPYVWSWRRPLHTELMHQAAQSLLGEFDFAAFRSSECQAKTSRREISHFAVLELGHFVLVDIAANAFLHHMVRILVGHLMLIGMKQFPWYWLREVCAAGTRLGDVAMAPAQGLHFVGVDYLSHCWSQGTDHSMMEPGTKASLAPDPSLLMEPGTRASLAPDPLLLMEPSSQAPGPSFSSPFSEAYRCPIVNLLPAVQGVKHASVSDT